jgi:hypothetical protein
VNPNLHIAGLHVLLYFFNLILHGGGGVESRSTRHCGHLMTYCVSAPGDYDNGEIGGMIGRGNRSTRRKPAPVPLYPPQTPHAARTRTRAAAVGSQLLTSELRHGLCSSLPNHVS